MTTRRSTARTARGAGIGPRAAPAVARARPLLLALLVSLAPLAAQEGTLDLADGETLYDGGWLWTLGWEYDRASGGGVRREEHAATLGVSYGLRHDLQLTLTLPYRWNEEAGGGSEVAAQGLGDLGLFAKWRIQRWDAPHVATNLAILGGLELPTGPSRERDGGVLVPLELQPGSGSVDPVLGIGFTHEPGRWRFNAAALQQWNTQGRAGDERGDQFFAELAAGNRFWLEPYPGPFMRLDLLLRYRHEGRDQQAHAPDPDSGRDLLSAGLNLAFRPQPSLDFQLLVEVPLAEARNGAQPRQEILVALTSGIRF